MIDSTYAIEKLTEIINNDRAADGDPFISPDEDYIIFRGNNREDSFGGSDLYISFKINGQWTDPENLGEPINSSFSEICPLVTPDGKLFIFSSNRLKDEFKPEPLADLDPYRKKFNSFDNGTYNIYAISANFIESRRKKHFESY
jgi:Tol biopolymer transport system component